METSDFWEQKETLDFWDKDKSLDKGDFRLLGAKGR